MNSTLPNPIETPSSPVAKQEFTLKLPESFSASKESSKYSKARWDSSVLKGIKLQTALSELRTKDRELRALKSQRLTIDF